jgi:hypothetical protein
MPYVIDNEIINRIIGLTSKKKLKFKMLLTSKFFTGFKIAIKKAIPANIKVVAALKTRGV